MNSEKIPYDSQPIYRQSNNNKKRKNERNSSSSKPLAFVVCVLVLLNVVLCGLVISVSKKLNSSSMVNNFNISATGLDVSYVVDKIENSVVEIRSGTIENVNTGTFGLLQKSGSGVIIKDDKDSGECLILTCYHVVSDYRDNLWIRLPDSFNPIKATLYSKSAYSSKYDLAVIKIQSEEYKTSSCHPCEVADSSLVRRGDGVVAFGNPQGQGLSVSSGEISKTINIVKSSDTGVHHRVLRTTAPINGGNSGGGLFDAEGRLIGIVSLKVSSEYIDNVAYAIPSDVACALAENIIKNDRPYKVKTGLTLNVKNAKIEDVLINDKIYSKQTIVVSKVEGAGLIAGFKEKDEIVSFSYGNSGEIQMLNLYSLEDHIFNLDTDQNNTVTFVVYRPSENKKITLTLKITERGSADETDWYA